MSGSKQARLTAAAALGLVLVLSAGAPPAREAKTAVPPPTDPQRVQGQVSMTWADDKLSPGTSNHATLTVRAVSESDPTKVATAAVRLSR
jgi:hypothetical protein